MKLLLLIFFLVNYVWAGWYSSSAMLEEGVAQAQSYPLGTTSGLVVEDNCIVSGSAVIVNENGFFTASHIFPDLDKGLGKKRLKRKYSFCYQNDEETQFYPIEEFCTFPSQDLVFCVTEKSFSKKDIAPVIPLKDYIEFINPYQKDNVSQDNKGYPAFFFGYGHKIPAAHLLEKSRAEMEAIQSYKAPVDRHALGAHFGERAVGECFISQHFKLWKNQQEEFFAWTSYGKKGKDFLPPLLSSALPGDSGGPMMIEKDGNPYLVGVVSSIYVGNRWDQGEKTIGTSFASLYSSSLGPPQKGYLEEALSNLI